MSQAPPTSPGAEVTIRAVDEGVPMLGAVLSYGALVAPLQHAYLERCAREPARLSLRLDTPVSALKEALNEVEVDAGIAERFDLAVVAEGGVFGEQSHKAVSRDYRQTAWVGQVSLDGGAADLAIERFTSNGPAGAAAAAGALGRHCAACDAPRRLGVVCAGGR